MTKQTIRRLHQIYGILLAVVTVVAGVCLMVACLGIYHSGDKPYSREAVAAAFAPISIPVYLCLGLVAGSFLLHLFLPMEEGRLKATPDAAMRLERLYARTDVSRWEAAACRQVQQEQRLRRVHRLVTGVLAAIGTAVFLVYALDSRHFSSTDVNGSMIKAMLWLTPCALLPCVYGIIAWFVCTASVRRETAILTAQLVARVVDDKTKATGEKEEAVKASAEAVEAPSVAKRTAAFPERAVRYGVLAVGLALLVYGFATGGIADVLTKAVNICTECIGLG